MYTRTTTQDIRPPIILPHALNAGLCVAPVTRNPTNMINNVKAPIPEAINTKQF